LTLGARLTSPHKLVTGVPRRAATFVRRRGTAAATALCSARPPPISRSNR